MKKFLYIAFLFLTVFAFGQERTVFGNVIFAEDRLPLPGTTVMIKNTNKGTSADFEGNYSLKNVTPNDTLVFSFVSTKTQEIRADKEEINVIMEDDGEIIKVVYGPPIRPREPFITASVTRVTAKDIKNADNPKYNFKRNAKNNVFIVFVSELTSYDFNKEELEFQQKYNVKYSLSEGKSVRYFKKYNKLTFKHLNKKI